MQNSSEGISKKIQQWRKQVAGALKKKKVNKELCVSFKSAYQHEESSFANYLARATMTHFLSLCL